MRLKQVDRLEVRMNAKTRVSPFTGVEEQEDR